MRNAYFRGTMMYFHHTSCISPQDTFGEAEFATLHKSENNWLTIREPKYENIPRGLLRRMGKAVRMGVGTALPLIEKVGQIDGIILGTANGGMEDCIKFLNQVIEFDEGTLTPTNFVQSTTNAIAGQIGLMTQNTGHNATHVHRGLAFENALLDAAFQLSENPNQTFLVGGVDEISDYNFNIDFQAGWYKKDPIENTQLLASKTPGSMAGEGAAFFTANANPEGAVMKLSAINTLHSKDPKEVKRWLQNVAKSQTVDALILGENGDVRLEDFYQNARDVFGKKPVLPYKHLCGEYPTSSAFALWLAMQTFAQKKVPPFVGSTQSDGVSSLLIYNCYQGLQHSAIIVEKTLS